MTDISTWNFGEKTFSVVARKNSCTKTNWNLNRQSGKGLKIYLNANSGVSLDLKEITTLPLRLTINTRQHSKYVPGLLFLRHGQRQTSIRSLTILSPYLKQRKVKSVQKRNQQISINRSNTIKRSRVNDRRERRHTFSNYSKPKWVSKVL